MAETRSPARGQIRVPWKALAVMAVLTLASLAGLSWQLGESREHEVRQWEARLGAMATDRALGLDRWLLERLGDARVLAQDLGPEAGTAEELESTREELELAVTAYGYRAGWLLDPDGAVLTGTEGLAPHSGETGLAARTLATGRPEPWFFTEPESHVSVAAPLPEGTGAVVLRADPRRYLIPFLGAETLPTRTGETLLARVEGDSIVFLTQPRMADPGPGALTRPLVSEGLAMAAALRGQETFGRFTDYRGAPVFAATQRLENAPWGLVVKVDQEEAMMEHGRFRAALLVVVLGLILAALGGVTAYWSWRRSRERTAAAEALNRSEEKHRLLFQQSRDAIFLTNPDGRVLDVNPACIELLGMDPDHLDRYDALQFYVDPEDRERFRRILVEEGGVTDFEVQLQDVEGTPFHALYSAAVLRNDDGAVTAFHGTVRDITERKEAEEELRRSRERLEKAQRIAHVGDWTWDVETGDLTWSEEIYRIFGLTPGEFEESYAAFLHRIHPDDREAVTEAVDAAVRDGVPYAIDHRVVRPDGEVRVVHEQGEVERDEEERAVRMLGTVHDVTGRVETEQELRASEERLRLTFQNAPTGVAVVGLDGAFIRVNPELCRIVGYEQEELEGKTFQEITHPEDLDEEVSYVQDLLEGKIESYEMEKRYLREDGDAAWVHLTGSLVRGPDGSPLHFVVHAEDISEQVEARRELEASERRFRSLIEHGSDLIALLDAQGTLRYQSPAYERVLGYAEDELVGEDPFQLIHPEDLPEVRGTFSELLAQPGGRVQMALRFRHAQGSWRTLEARATNLLDDPAVGAVVVNSRDVTERREAEARTERTSARLQAILDTITDAVVLVRPDGTIDFANPAAEEILGITPSEVAGRRYDDPGWEISALDGGPFPHEELPFVRVTATNAEVRDVRHAIERPGGEKAVLSINAAPIRDPEGELAGMVASIQDVTERIRAEGEIRRLNEELEERVRRRTAELQAANQELEAFAYSVSHDLRAPLRAMDGFSLALMEDYGDRLEDEAHEFLERIRTNSQRMSQLIDDILQLSRISRKELNRKEVDLVALARENVEELREMEPDRKVTLVAPETLSATGDPQLLRVVLDNLLGNAWKFTRHEEEAVIELGADESGDERSFWVRDNGVGFDMNYADKLFKAFHRLHRDSEFEGTGIGLATVQRIVHRHGGRVEAEGEVGQGATIRFTLEERAGG